ncbi:type I-F CRISPR-associated endoribonuclease Cas6/Csy4 [Ferrimonas lipolytica]|uniref:Type I-F CRISPR-associated endoribonuclease Cas6/Csy4 n=1 Tax=Ferrimonas lipolytica TaxID=2724191 RepID=A0A6H1UBL6_9GAMM|nr:type I-F CRISPR-associated endoribonuclease Cas6/Csy4 [Ferrimonas lipolytica]QIZ75763.1 type I-F CRISPR-associated endoribonuclease Cas6/Csy4 [Ferrimonas lipolytica]
MEQRYFFAIRYVAKRADFALLAGRCISVLHGFLSRHQLTGIGVNFPDWTESSLGQTIAFVGKDVGFLGQLRKQSYFEMMERDQLFERSKLKPVPQGCREIQFKRNQNIAKCFPGEKRRRLERAKRRAEARGEVFAPAETGQASQLEAFHSILMHSKSSSQQYLLHIQRKVGLELVSEDFGQYGLATNLIHQGTQPELPRGRTLFD